MSKAKVMSRLRAKYGRKAEVGIDYYRTALPAWEKENRRTEIRKLEQEEQAARARAKEIGKYHWEKLLEMAQFVVDVEGDPAAVARLSEAVKLTTEVNDLHERASDLHKQQKKLACGLHKDRYEAYVVDRTIRSFPLATIVGHGWTLTELLESIK